jgi:hypothetical protein
MFEDVEIIPLDRPEERAMWSILYYGSLPEMTLEEFERRLQSTREILSTPSGAQALALRCGDKGLVLSRGEWSALGAILLHAGWEPADWYNLTAAEATQLAHMLTQILSVPNRDSWLSFVTPEFAAFFRGGAVTVTAIG